MTPEETFRGVDYVYFRASDELVAVIALEKAIREYRIAEAGMDLVALRFRMQWLVEELHRLREELRKQV